MNRLRYGRRLAVVAAVIGAIIGLGFVWRASSAASLVADGRGGPDGGRLAPPGASAPGRDGERVRRGEGGAFKPANLDDLAQTMMIGGATLVAVVVVDRSRRRRHPIRR